MTELAKVKSKSESRIGPEVQFHFLIRCFLCTVMSHRAKQKSACSKKKIDICFCCGYYQLFKPCTTLTAHNEYLSDKQMAHQEGNAKS